MNRKFWMLSRSLPMMFAVLIILLTGCKKEPEYEGVGLKRWIQQLSADDPILRSDAAQAIGAIGKIAREPSEPTLRQVAKYDPRPAVRVTAIQALKSIGAPTGDFDAYLKEVTKTLADDVVDDDGSIGQGDLDFQAESQVENGDMGGSSSSQQDLEFLQALEALKDSVRDTISESDMPSGDEEKKMWMEQRRSDAVSTLMQELQNPEVLAEMMKSSDPLQRRLAARMLQNQEGGANPRVFESLNMAKADSDSVLRKIANDALKKWTGE